MTLTRVLFLLCGLVLATLAIPRSPQYLQRKLYNQRMKSRSMQADAQYPFLQQSNFTQKLDHFDPTNTATWPQKYYYNPSYTRNNSIVFLMIGGEGPEGPHWAADPDVQYLQWAKEFGADVFDLEHRFFGDSWPVPNMDTSSLSLLTTEQALADLAYFIESMNQLHGFNNPRWVTFGGSYPGSLSAWFRSKYPHLTVGAVASSAPVNLKLDFYEYAMVVEDDLRLTDPKCADATRTAFQQMQQMTMTKLGRQQLSATFHLNPPFADNATKLDITNFFGNVYNVFQGMTQYTYDGQSNKTHMDQTDASLCKIMTDPSHSALENVYNLILWFNKINGDDRTTFDNSYWDAINAVKSGDLAKLGEDNAAARGWMWLCCNEIGFMQTTDQGNNIFGSTIPINLFVDMCTDMFGDSIAADHLYNTNQRAQKYYGGADKYRATNVVLPNGSMDPWHALGTYKADKDNAVTPILINGTAHCSDMYPSYVGEPPALVDARTQIKAQVKAFIRYDPVRDGPTPAPTPGSTTDSTSPTPTPEGNTASSSPTSTPGGMTGSSNPTPTTGSNSINGISSAAAMILSAVISLYL